MKHLVSAATIALDSGPMIYSAFLIRLWVDAASSETSICADIIRRESRFWESSNI